MQIYFQQCNAARLMSSIIISKEKGNFRTHALPHPIHDKCMLLTPSAKVAAKIWEAQGSAAAANKRRGGDGGAVCLCMWWCHGKDLVSNVNNSQVAEAGGHCHIINVLSHSLVSSPWMHSSNNGQQLDSGFREDS